MIEKNKPIPDGFHSINLYIVVKDAEKAISFYQAAFGAKEKSRYKLPNGKIVHAEIQIGDSTVQLSDELSEHNCGVSSPESLKGTSSMIHLYVNDVDAVFDSAIKAGAKVKKKLENMFWGDRYGQVEDPFGHLWSIATQIESLTPEQIEARAPK